MANWEEKNNTLIKDFKFSSFNEAIDFVNKIAELANKADHHPDILIHGYNAVEIRLTTHSELSTVTKKDHDLSEQIEKLYTSTTK